VLDTVQFGLDGAGMLPGVGIIPDGINVCISVGRGEWGAAGFSAGAMVPLFGHGVTAGKVVSRAGAAGARHADRVATLIDPQLDANILIRLLYGDPDVIAFIQANRAAGLSYNVYTRAEFLSRGTRAQLRLLEETYGIRLIQNVTPNQIDDVARRLEQAFDGTGRRLGTGDARVAATAYLTGERLATGDLQFYKRARDLGLQVEFVGTGRAAARAAAYQPDLVTIPSP